MSLSQDEANAINSAITELRNDAKALASINRQVARDVANIGKRLQKVQEQMQLVMATYKKPPIKEMQDLIKEVKNKIAKYEGKAKPKGK